MHAFRSIQKALDLIEVDLREPLSMESLARRVGLSHWHFQRTFTAMTGQPAGGYIRRRRLTEAARCLRETRRTILDVALDHCFESHEVFTRAFKTEMGVTPSEWRAGQSPGMSGLTRIFLSHENIKQRYQHMHLTPEIVTLPPRSFVGLQARFITAISPNANNMKIIPALWTRFLPRLGEIETNEPEVCYGLCDRPESSAEQDLLPDEALYLAAMQTASGSVPPHGMEKWISPGGSFAKFTHRGPIAQIGEVMGYIYGVWLPGGNYDRGPGPDLERMDERFNPQGINSVLEIFIPVQVRAATS